MNGGVADLTGPRVLIGLRAQFFLQPEWSLTP
jgi:hypothetical protein